MPLDLKYTQPDLSDLKEAPNKPVAFCGQRFPYTALGYGRFEELLYSIGKLLIMEGRDWNGKYDKLHLLGGVRDRGRDVALYQNGKSYGLIQCKHSIHSGSKITKPECAREIIKFVLHSFLDKRLIHDPKNFTYWFAVSHGFNEKALALLVDFNKQILKQKELKKWTKDVIEAHRGLSDLTYTHIESELKTVLKDITIETIGPQDLDLWLNTNGFKPIIKTFFEVKTVTESEPIEKLTEQLKKQNEYRSTSNIPVDVILKKIDDASYHLTEYNSSFTGVDHSHVERRKRMISLNGSKHR